MVAVKRLSAGSTPWPTESKNGLHADVQAVGDEGCWVGDQLKADGTRRLSNFQRM